MRRLLLAVVAIVALVGIAACSGPPKAYLPIDSPLRPWTAPEPTAQQVEPAEEPEAPAEAPADTPAAAPAETSPATAPG